MLFFFTLLLLFFVVVFWGSFYFGDDRLLFCFFLFLLLLCGVVALGFYLYLPGFKLFVGARVFFAFDSSELTGESRAALDRQVAYLKQFPSLSATVEGHADERGTREYNLALGERRASAVKNYLVSGGIQARRLHAISYGKERPMELGSNESAWARNRRAVTVID